MPAVPTATNCPLNVDALIVLVEIGVRAVQVKPSALVTSVPAAPSATKRLVVVVTAVVPVPVVVTNEPKVTALKSLVVLLATEVQVAASVLVTIVPVAPTATYRPRPKVAPYKFFVVPDVGVVHVLPSTLAMIVPAAPTARNAPVPVVVTA